MITRTLVLVAAIFAIGCQHARRVPDDLKYHVISIDEDGRAEDPLVEKRVLKDPQYQKHIAAVLEHMSAYLDQSPNHRVVIFIHGGLNEPDRSLERAAKLYRKMLDEDDCYPIFINWNSGLVSAYLEQATSIRQGAKYDSDSTRPWGIFATPLFLLADFGRTLFRTPIVWSQQVVTEQDVSGWYQVAKEKRTTRRLTTRQADEVPTEIEYEQFAKEGARLYEVSRRYEVLIRLQHETPQDAMQVSLGQDRMSKNEWTRRGVVYFVTIPSKYAISPMLDFVKPAWDNMGRRTQMMYLGPPRRVTAHTSDRQLLADIEGRGHGALQLFMEAFVQSSAVTEHRRIDLVGHSMGCIVLNELIRRFPQPEYANIVYMAAACSIQDFHKCVIPYVTQHPSTHFYNLCLHPMADDMETHGLDLPPRGSLLVWIDNFLADPQTPMDWTLGRWENVVLAANIFYPVRTQVSVKSFDLLPRQDQREGNPQEHGDFTLQRFWDPEFWRVDPLESQNFQQAATQPIERSEKGKLQMK